MEILMLASYKHDNLVSLVGFYDKDNEKIIVYAHEVCGSLDKYLATTDLTWVQRLQICLGASHGLNYLHNGVGEGPTNQEFTFLVTNACGTHGYIDPSYETTDILTKESDVYSFGVVIYEVLCGRIAIITECHDDRRFLSRLAKLYLGGFMVGVAFT
ncbi:probable receptor-like protein kinase [Tanacetum coccineum]